MKFKPILGLLLLTAMLFTGCNAQYKHLNEAIRPELIENETSQSIPDVGIQTVIEESESKTVAVHYPTIGNDKVDALLKEFALNRVELFYQETANIQVANDENWPYELHIDYEIAYQTERHLSLVFREEKYLGGAQSVSALFTYNFNLDHSRQLMLRDVFKGSSAYLEIISQFIYDSLINQNSLGIPLDESWVVEGSTPLESNFKHFLIGDQGVTFLFEKYQLAPAFIGEPSILIPYDVFTAHIELKEIFLPAPSKAERILPDLTQTTIMNPVEGAVKKKIAITFEDGPHPFYTPLILDTLSSRNTLATFFILGNRAQDYPDLIERIAVDGHSIGNHSWSHPQMTRLSFDALNNQYERTQELVATITGSAPLIYRPPYGIYNENVISILKSPAVLWSIDPGDLVYKDSAYITNYVIDHAFDGAIILLRDTNAHTTQALSAIIDELTQLGYAFVTVDQLLGITEENASQNIRIFSRGFESK